MTIRIDRIWDMPNADTMLVPSIRSFTLEYLAKSKVSVDPFARNCRLATYTNDLNPDTAAEYHMDAREFCRLLIAQGVKADLAIVDPPFSQVQVARAYQSIGREYKPFGDDNNATLYRETRDLVTQILEPNGIALSFGWNSSGFGNDRGFAIERIMLVAHGGAHNDTICMAERKLPADAELFDKEAA